MKDTVIKGSGNSRFLRSVPDFMAKYPTYQDFVKALVAGTLPIDLNGVNAAGYQQQGTPLNKGTLLSDNTASELGLDPNNDPTVDDAFGSLPPRLGNVPGYSSDIWLFITGNHPVLNAGPYRDYETLKIKALRDQLARSVKTPAEGKTFTVYDGGNL